MTKHKGFRFMLTLAICIAVLCCFSVTAFAGADDVDQELPEVTQTPNHTRSYAGTRTVPEPTPAALT
jgi:hypothetical protein